MTHAEQVDIENRLHDKYFAPFDQLLERKAEYYLRRVDEIGEEKCRPMLREIEVLERFREYAVMMETILQKEIDTHHRMAEQIQFWKENADLHYFLFNHAIAAADHFKHLHQ